MTKNSLFVFILSFVLALSCSPLEGFAQTYADGPIFLGVKVRDVNVTFNATDEAVFGVGFAPDEVTIKLWARDNANIAGLGWVGGTCLEDDFMPPGQTIDFNHIIFNHNYTGGTVPMYFDLRLEAWEDDIPSDGVNLGGIGSFCTQGNRCDYNPPVCCGIMVFGTCVGITTGDDYHCNANPFKIEMDYRLGPPCQWYNHGYVTGAGCSNNFYQPRIESFWRYTKGTSCTDPIDLGPLNTGGQLSHFNSNICYSNTFGQPGNDVFYTFSIAAAMGVDISLCGANGATFDSYLYLLDASCNIDTSNDNSCGNQSRISKFLCNPGTYIVVVDGKTASEQGTFTLTISENATFAFSAAASKTDVSCFGGSDGVAWVTVSGGIPPYSFLWSNIGVTDTISGLSAGLYSVIVSDMDGCTATASVIVNQPAQLQVSVAGTDVTCSGINDGTATVSATNGTTPYSYLWSTNPPQTFPTASALSPGNYTVTVTDFKGCQETGTVTISANTAVVITLVSLNHISCFGQNDGSISISASGGSAPFSYAWSNGDSTGSISGLIPGVYSVTVTDGQNCQEFASYTINEPAILTVSIANTLNVSCNGFSDGGISISVNGGTPPYFYTWSNGQTSEDLLGIPAGNYDVSVTDANGCQATVSAVVNEPTALSLQLTATDAPCFGQPGGSASVVVSGGTAPFSYQWSNFETGPSISGISGGSYQVVVTDNNNCVAVQAVVVNEGTEISATFVATNPDCNDASTGTIQTTVSGGVAPYGFLWNNGNNNANPAGLSAGQYTLTVTDASNCEAVFSVELTDPEDVQLSLTAIHVNCKGGSDGVAIADVEGGTPPYSFVWSNGSTVGRILSNLPQGDYSVTISDANGCTVTSAVVINDPIENPEDCKDDQYGLLVPTAFTPNMDGMNDYLNVIAKGARVVEMRIFNRWGEEVYYNTNMLDSENGWDGTFRGKNCPTGTYTWNIRVEFWNGVEDYRAGAVTLIR